MRKFRLFAILWAVVTAGVLIPDLVQYWHETTALRQVAIETRGEARTPHEVVARVVAAVKERVIPVTDGKFYKVNERPILRHTAWQSWQNSEGLCGEGARLILNILRTLQIPASRVNLMNDGTGFYHVAVAYYDKGDWWLIDSINSAAGFYEWTLGNQLPIAELVTATMDPGGQLLIGSANPYFGRFSYFNWARVFGTSIEINQRVPFPGPVIAIIENPPLFLALLKFSLAAVVLGLGVIVFAVAKARRTRERAIAASR